MTSNMKFESVGEGRDCSLWKTEIWSGHVIGYEMLAVVSRIVKSMGQYEQRKKGHTNL
jgi:hypothetical protein